MRRRDDVLLGECEMSFVYHMLSRIPEDFPCYVEELVSSAQSLFRKYPPDNLRGEVEQYIRERYQLFSSCAELQNLATSWEGWLEVLAVLLRCRAMEPSNFLGGVA